MVNISKLVVSLEQTAEEIYQDKLPRWKNVDEYLHDAAVMLMKLKKAVQHYEQALLESYPDGAKCTVFDNWNEARKLVNE